MKLTDELKFGKYSGLSVREVIEDDPEYIEWCLDEVDSFKLNDEAMALFDEYLDTFYADCMDKFGKWDHPYA